MRRFSPGPILVIGFTALLFGGMGVNTYVQRQANVMSPIWRHTSGGWQESPRLQEIVRRQGIVMDIQVSRGGKVWAAWAWVRFPGSTGRGGLVRLDGDHWSSFGGKDFGTDGYVSGGFALDGEDLWAATPE